MKPNLRLLDSDEPTAAEVYMARIIQSHREYRSPEPDVSGQGWQPVTTDATNLLPVDAIQGRSYKVVVTDSPVPFWRKVMRWLKR